MFRGIFGTKSDRPTPPKNQIEVVCPTCGAAQYEPRLVVSTFCKKCGVHLTIHRKRVTASNVTRSGIGAVESRQNGQSPTNGAAPTAPLSPPAKASTPNPAAEELPPELAEPVTPEEAAEGGFGVFLKQQTAPATAKPAPKTGPLATPAEVTEPSSSVEASEKPVNTEPLGAEEPVTYQTEAEREEEVPRPNLPSAEERYASSFSRRPQSNSPAPTPTPAPMSASTLQKMKDQGMYRNQYFKDAECFDCGHKFKVSRSSRSTNCPSCGAAIAMDDVEINMPSTQPIKTRGDVLIRKRGIVSTDSVRCKDLRCYGTLEANVEAAGDAIFRTTGTMIGTIRCKRLVVEKGTDVTFLNKVYAEEVDIQARVTGSIISSGPLVIGANGCVNGDVTARSISIDPGGELNGAMNIVRGPAKPKPPAPPAESDEASSSSAS